MTDRTQLLRLMDGSLDAPEAERLRVRLERDATLRDAWQRLQATQAALHTHDASFDDGFAQRVMERLRPAAPGETSLAEVLQPLFVRMELAAFTLIAGLAVYNVTAMSEAVVAASLVEMLFGLPGTTLENVLLLGAQ